MDRNYNVTKQQVYEACAEGVLALLTAKDLAIDHRLRRNQFEQIGNGFNYYDGWRESWDKLSWGKTIFPATKALLSWAAFNYDNSPEGELIYTTLKGLRSQEFKAEVIAEFKKLDKGYPRKLAIQILKGTIRYISQDRGCEEAKSMLDMSFSNMPYLSRCFTTDSPETKRFLAAAYPGGKDPSLINEAGMLGEVSK